MNKKQFEKENPDLKSEMIMEESIASAELAMEGKQTIEDLKEKQEAEFDKYFPACDCGNGKPHFSDLRVNRDRIKNFISKAKKETSDFERQRIVKIIKDMPEEFPELESDIYDTAYQDAKEYLLNKIK